MHRNKWLKRRRYMEEIVKKEQA
ncbi:MarR family transcriptional regulator, partial [Clostridioides difficile]